MMKRIIPSLASWNMYAGGTAAWTGAHAYDIHGWFGEYHIGPITTTQGLRAGYGLHWADTKGLLGRGLWTDLGRFMSPEKAATVANKHAESLSRGNPVARRGGRGLYEHVRIAPPGQFQRGSFRTIPVGRGGKKLVIGRLKGAVTTQAQAVLIPKGEARALRSLGQWPWAKRLWRGAKGRPIRGGNPGAGRGMVKIGDRVEAIETSTGRWVGKYGPIYGLPDGSLFIPGHYTVAPTGMVKRIDYRDPRKERAEGLRSTRGWRHDFTTAKAVIKRMRGGLIIKAGAKPLWGVC